MSANKNDIIEEVYSDSSTSLPCEIDIGVSEITKKSPSSSKCLVSFGIFRRFDCRLHPSNRHRACGQKTERTLSPFHYTQPGQHKLTL